MKKMTTILSLVLISSTSAFAGTSVQDTYSRLSEAQKTQMLQAKAKCEKGFLAQIDMLEKASDRLIVVKIVLNQNPDAATERSLISQKLNAETEVRDLTLALHGSQIVDCNLEAVRTVIPSFPNQ